MKLNAPFGRIKGERVERYKLDFVDFIDIDRMIRRD